MDPKDKNSKDELDNRSNQLNDNNNAYWLSRGEERPSSPSTDNDDDDNNGVHGTFWSEDN